MHKVLAIVLIWFGSLLITDMSWAWENGPQHQHYRPYRPMSPGKLPNMYLSFSFGEGVYLQYECCYGCNCDTFEVAPADVEALLGIRLAKHWYVDLGAVWSIDYTRYGDQLSSMVGLRPGIRLVLPGLFNRLYYFRLALPLLFGISGDNTDKLVGLMLGAGVQWNLGNLGFFGEVNVTPYFVQVADAYYVFPAQGRIGVSIGF